MKDITSMLKIKYLNSWDKSVHNSQIEMAKLSGWGSFIGIFLGCYTDSKNPVLIILFGLTIILTFIFLSMLSNVSEIKSKKGSESILKDTLIKADVDKKERAIEFIYRTRNSFFIISIVALVLSIVFSWF